MGIYLNPGNELFQMSLNSEIYVDKTMLIKHTNDMLFTSGRYLAVSRPRRFGKTVALDMLCAYYSKACDSREMFAPYRIAEDADFEKHLNRYHVIQLNMRDIVSGADSVDAMLEKLTRRLVFEMKEAEPALRLFDQTDLLQSLSDLYAQTKIPFIFLIDEWDAIFRVYKSDEVSQTKYLDFLRNLLKDKPYVALAYMTGILPIKKYGEHSALNMFTEYSMTEAVPISQFTGFTTEEVCRLCERYEVSYETMKSWYDGYRVDEVDLYNPRSVVLACTKQKFDNYWTKTETYEALKVYIEMNFDGLRDTVIHLMSGGRAAIDVRSFSNDMVTFVTKDDVLTLLIHLGYLTYDFDTKEVWIPNQEIMGEYATTIKVLGWSEVAEALRTSEQLLKATIGGDAETVETLLEQAHQSETSIMAYHDENALASVITIAYYTARKDYELIREMPSGKGYADIVFLPKKTTSAPAMIVELKVDQSAQTAIAQIREKNYVEGLRGYQGKVLLIGITYDRKTKKHHCQIEEVEV